MTHRLARLAALTAVAACAASSLGVATAAQAATGPVRLVVRTTASVPSKAALQRSLGALHVRSVRSLGEGLAAVTVDAAGSGRATAVALDASPLVSGASVDRRFTTAGTKAPVGANDPYFRDEWDLWDATSTARAGGYGVDASRAWTVTKGSSSVVVAVLDTGITQHPDLSGMHVAAGYDFVSPQPAAGSDPGVDPRDGDGWDSDPTDMGDSCPAEGENSSWHGTFVTGEIAAQQNRAGVVGEAPGVTIEPVRVLGACGGSEADLIAAIEWASGGTVTGANPSVNPTPARVLSLSLGSTGDCSAAMQTAITDALDRGSIVVAAAGNDGGPVADTSPANCSGVISVAASSRSGGLATAYSNHGTSARSPTIAAPGGTDTDPILGDTWASKTTLTLPADARKAALGYAEGTSMATPRVSAAIALLLSKDSGLTVADVTHRLQSTATHFSSKSGCTAQRCGPGIVNAGNLVGAELRFVHRTAARVVGMAVVGHHLRAEAGTWYPAAGRITYRWLRDGKPIGGATHRTYVLRRRDLGHRVAVRVTGTRSNTVTASATSPSRRIR